MTRTMLLGFARALFSIFAVVAFGLAYSAAVHPELWPETASWSRYLVATIMMAWGLGCIYMLGKERRC